MRSDACFIVINNIKLPINASSQEAFSVAARRLSKARVPTHGVRYSIYRRSVDARKKNDIKFVYSVSAFGDFGRLDRERLKSNDMSVFLENKEINVEVGDKPLKNPPIIVGSGPAGLFAALLLAKHGYRPIILERGGSVAERQRAIERLNREHILDMDTNIQFGAGGAGTFSDGKLVTRINDPLTSYVLERFVEFGAGENIRYIAKPHVGTDVLSRVVDNMLTRIADLGGRIEYNTKFIRPVTHDGRVISVITNRGEIATDALVLAIGHSARDTYESLFSENMIIEPKDFSVGMRIEHLSQDIDRALYGDFAGHPELGRAEYNLSYDTSNRGVYTFCMCPGGEVVAAASEAGGVVVNGMSYNSRGGKNSNSAVVASVFKSDYGNTPASAIDFQRKIERAAFASAGGEYRAPIITVGDFLSDKCETLPKRIIPTYMQGENVKLTLPDKYLPSFVTRSIKNALTAFDKRISGFASPDAVLTGPETRTSAPVRIIRDSESRLAISYRNLYPAGEGAGYAGGITSAAIDGIKTAIAVIKEYKPF